MLAGALCDNHGSYFSHKHIPLFTQKLWRLIMKNDNSNWIYFAVAALFALAIFVVCQTIGCKQTVADPVDVSFTRTWTATGDDGIVGQVTQYDGRVALTEDSLNNNWNSCIQWIGVGITPLLSGQPESYTFILSVDVGQTYYFAIKAADEVPNWSLISNIVAEYIPDDIAPAAIIDLN